MNILKNKVTDERYIDPLTKSLAKYNSSVYDEIYEKELNEDFKIKDGVVQKIKGDINFYFDKYAPGDNQTKEFTKYITLYLALIAKNLYILMVITLKRMKFILKTIAIIVKAE